MAITISGANNVDKILATDGVLDSISGFSVVGVMTAGTFDVTGETSTGHLSVGSNIHIGNAGIITATTLVGNVTGNINHTSNLLLQISGSEKFRVGTSGQLGIGGANYGTSGQVLTSGGSGSAATWSTISETTINNNADNRVITGSGTANTLNGESGLTYDGNDLTITGAIPSLKFTESDGNPDYQLLSNNGIFKIHDVTNSADRFAVNTNGTGYFLSNFQIGSTTTSPGATLHIKTSYPSLKVDSGGHASDAYVRIISGNAQNSRVDFGDSDDDDIGMIDYDHANNSMRFLTNTNERLRIKSGGTVAIPSQGASNANPRLIFESSADSNDFTFSQYEDSNGVYTLIGQNLQLSSGGNTSVLDSGHKTSGILFDGRNNGAMMFYTGGTNAYTEKLRISSDGAIGLSGTNYGSSGQVLTSQGSGSAATWSTVSGTTINNNANNRVITGSGSANTLEGESTFTFDGSLLTVQKRMVIGNGTDFQIPSRSNTSSYTPQLQVTGAWNDPTHGGTLALNGRNDYPLLWLNSGASYQNNSGAGYIIFSIKDGAGNYCNTASIRSLVDGTPGNNDSPGDLSFLTTPDGTCNPVERMRIENGGNIILSKNQYFGRESNDATLHINTPSDGGQGGLYVHCQGQGGGSSSAHYGIKIDALNCANNANPQAGILIDLNQQYTQTGVGIQADCAGLYATTSCFEGILRKNLNAYSDGYTIVSNIIESGSGGSTYHIRCLNNGSQKMRVTRDGNLQNSNNSYGSLSDINLKENIVDANSQWNDIKGLKVRNFNFKDDPNKEKLIGVVAQEVETVSAGLLEIDNEYEVDESTGEATITGTTKYVKYSILYMKAVKALQEAQARIETLESKVSALEGS